MSNPQHTTDKIISLCKRRGFVYQGSEIYGGLAGVYDFGPHGVELLNNIKKSWWKANVYDRENYYGLDSGMFKNPRVWEASGHTSGFSDPLAECRECNTRIRVDKELEKAGAIADEKCQKRQSMRSLMSIEERLRVQSVVRRIFHQQKHSTSSSNQTLVILLQQGVTRCIFLERRVREFTLISRTLLIQ